MPPGYNLSANRSCRKEQEFKFGNISTPPSEVKAISVGRNQPGNMLEEITVLHHSNACIKRDFPRGSRPNLNNHAMTANKKQPATDPDEPYKRFFF
jgi:hypothetical protein